jgi:hypothetical protein
LLESGFKVKYYFSGSQEEDGDIHFIVSHDDPDFSVIDQKRLNACCRVMDFKPEDLTTAKELSLSDALVLTDDKPQLENMSSYWNELWRKRTFDNYLNDYTYFKIPFFQ